MSRRAHLLPAFFAACLAACLTPSAPDETDETDETDLTTTTGSDCNTDPDLCTNICGDGKMLDDEQCDDGNTDDTDACSNACTLAKCGDHIIQSTEQCDDGNSINTDACTNACETPKCGDNILQQGEQCDDGPQNLPLYANPAPPPSACSILCDHSFEFCGDSIQNGSEPCDDGKQTAACEAGCTLPTCGDAITNPQAGEACDDGNPVDTDACTTVCKTASCGDTFTQPPEQCDDGNQADGDGCSSITCLAERFVFVSPHRLFGDLSPGDPDFPILDPMLKGIPRADAYCTAVANDRRSYKAWLSDSTTHPAKRFDTTFSGPYRLRDADSSIVATGWPDLTDGTLDLPINVDSTGALVEENVWTHTLQDGTSADPQNPPCADWTSKEFVAFIGTSKASDATWTKRTGLGFDDPVTCSAPFRIYCFQDP